MPKGLLNKGIYLIKLVFDPYLFSGFASALVFLIGILFLGEIFTLGKVIGLLLIIIGTIVMVKF